MNGNDIFYGRIGTIFPSHKTRKKKNAIYIPIYWMNIALKPSYSYGLQSYLSYESDTRHYQLYNPQRHIFELEKMIVDIISLHRYKSSEIVGSFVIISDKVHERITK